MSKLPALSLLPIALFVSIVTFALPSFAIRPPPPPPPEHSVAREWNEQVLIAIRNDFARPTVHARNLFHTSIAMWDSWAAYDEWAEGYLHKEKLKAVDVAAARRETISYAVYRILVARFTNSPGAATSLPSFDLLMSELGFDPANTSTVGDTPAALGNRIAEAVLAFGATDGSNEANDYANLFYQPVNFPLIPAFPGNPNLSDPNRWQPLSLDFFIGQSGFPFPLGNPPFLSPEWGRVKSFALSPADRVDYFDDQGNLYPVYHDPGPPPMLGGERDAEYRAVFQHVLEQSALLDPADGVWIDIGPRARGNNTLGTNDGTGYDVNPATGLPYAPDVVPAADYYRVLAEFWADGPDSETPPGHWFTVANYVSDHPDMKKRIGGVGPIVSALEWDVKLYLALGGAVHDSAVSAWGVKGWYDYIRPVSAIRHLADLGQSSDPNGPSYHPQGLELVPGLIELVTEASIAPGERHEHLAGVNNLNVGKIAARAWRGPDYIADPATTTAGVDWILVENWWPYQRPTFVTPPFAGYVSGHSTFSRAAAEVLTLITGSEYFPGGYSEFHAPRNEFLVFEDGPSVDVTLRWATYRDAADESGISRIYGGIHPSADDIPGRFMGAVIGPDAYAKAQEYYGPWKSLDVSSVSISDEGEVWAHGKLRVGVHGPEDVFDPTTGVAIEVESEDGTKVTLDFAECSKFEGAAYLCFDFATRTTALFKLPVWSWWPSFEFWIHGEGDAPAVQASGPVRMRITTAAHSRAGSQAACAQRPGLLDCKEYIPWMQWWSGDL